MTTPNNLELLLTGRYSSLSCNDRRRLSTPEGFPNVIKLDFEVFTTSQFLRSQS